MCLDTGNDYAFNCFSRSSKEVIGNTFVEQTRCTNEIVAFRCLREGFIRPKVFLRFKYISEK